jgi:hypothetical protein
MSNLDRLVDAGLVDPERLQEEQARIIEEELSDAEIDALVSVQRKFGGAGTMHGVVDEAAVFF